MFRTAGLLVARVLGRGGRTGVSESSEAPAWPRASAAWWAIGVFTLCAVSSYTDRNALSLLVDQIRAELLISDTQMSLIQGLAFASAYAIAGLPLGRLADQGQRVRLMIVGILLWSSATAACGLATDFTSMFVARVLVGVGEAALAPAVFSMIGDLFPPHRQGTATAVFTAGTTVGQGTSLIIGGGLFHLMSTAAPAQTLLFGDLAPWRVVLLCLAAPGVPIALLLWMTVREPARRGIAIAGHSRRRTRDVLAAFLERRRYIFPLWIALALWTAGDAAMSGWAPTFLSRVYHTPIAAIGTNLGTLAIMCGVAGTLLGGFLGDRLSVFGGPHLRISAAAAVSAMGIATATIYFRIDMPIAFACIGLWIALSNLCQILVISALQEVLPSDMRGVNIACIAFFDLFFGASIGHGSAAALTDYVFQDPQAVGRSIAIVTASAASIATLLFWSAARPLAAQHPRAVAYSSV
ncbi:MAG TPA: MFS transporter [Steroidobacter sp.]|uniref:MFS transporter n=1 Tax=Steroidobacter sp. TaxID=1978227 RepID=UPI002EDB1E79